MNSHPPNAAAARSRDRQTPTSAKVAAAAEAIAEGQPISITVIKVRRASPPEETQQQPQQPT